MEIYEFNYEPSSKLSDPTEVANSICGNKCDFWLEERYFESGREKLMDVVKEGLVMENDKGWVYHHDECTVVIATTDFRGGAVRIASNKKQNIESLTGEVGFPDKVRFSGIF
tara:strand:+ start:4454 stop:4789 length:336 start_codon:yes stop_codon:yes gene_type:complete